MVMSFMILCMLPHLQPFNGINPNSVVVLDNCSIHHVEEAIVLIQSVGALVLYLPPTLQTSCPLKSASTKSNNFCVSMMLAFKLLIDN